MDEENLQEEALLQAAVSSKPTLESNDEKECNETRFDPICNKTVRKRAVLYDMCEQTEQPIL